jgi:pimeloyl-ACP methyl ester carboxylesterase
MTRPRSAYGTWKRTDVFVGERLRVALFEAGPENAPPLVLLHGVGHWSQAAWDPIVPELAGDYRLIAFDLPGFGDSEKPDVAYDLAFFTGVLKDVVDALGLRRFALAGNSLGGMIAAEYAGEQPERVAALGLMAPAGFLCTIGLIFRAFAFAPFCEHVPIAAPHWLVRHTLELSTYDPRALGEETHERAYLLAADPLVRRAFARVYCSARDGLLHQNELLARFARYTGPALVCWGRNDRFLPVAGVECARRTYPQATVMVLDHCGHLPQVEEPARVAAGLRAIYRTTA